MAFGVRVQGLVGWRVTRWLGPSSSRRSALDTEPVRLDPEVLALPGKKAAVTASASDAGHRLRHRRALPLTLTRGLPWLPDPEGPPPLRGRLGDDVPEVWQLVLKLEAALQAQVATALDVGFEAGQISPTRPPVHEVP